MQEGWMVVEDAVLAMLDGYKVINANIDVPDDHVENKIFHNFLHVEDGIVFINRWDEYEGHSLYKWVNIFTLVEIYNSEWRDANHFYIYID